LLGSRERYTMKITVIQKASPKKTPKHGCPWMIDDYVVVEKK
jgi:hypothetical protein